jgi:hypothetical protein
MPAVSPGGRAVRVARGVAVHARVKSAGYLAPALAVIRGQLQADLRNRVIVFQKLQSND